MTAPLSAERVEELRLRIEHLQYLFSADRVDLDAILADYSSLRAENERLRGEAEKWVPIAEMLVKYEMEPPELVEEFEHLRKHLQSACEKLVEKERHNKELKARAEKAEAELALGNKAWDIKQKQLEEARAELEKNKEWVKLWQGRADELDKELAAVAPLTEAVMGAMDGDLEECIKVNEQPLHPDPCLDIIRAALKYREGAK